MVTGMVIFGHSRFSAGSSGTIDWTVRARCTASMKRSFSISCAIRGIAVSRAHLSWLHLRHAGTSKSVASKTILPTIAHCAFLAPPLGRPARSGTTVLRGTESTAFAASRKSIAISRADW